MMKNDSGKIQDEKALTREERAERRKQRKQLSRQRRADRIEQAKRTLQEDSRPYFIERAKQTLIEDGLAERIDQLRQELKDVRVKHRVKLREIRTKERAKSPVSEEERAKRRERTKHPISEKERAKRGEHAKRVSSHRLKTFAMINRIIEELVGKEESEVFDLLPHDQALILSQVSYGQIADMLEDRDHKTLYGKKWSRASVKRILERQGGKKYKGVGHVEDKQKAANDQRLKKADEFAIKMRNKELLLKDTTLTPHEIARELNKRGVKTSSKKENSKWVNSSVNRLLDRIDELEHAIKAKDEVLPLIDLTQTPYEIARELNRRGVKISSKKKDEKWEKKIVEKLLRRIEWLKE